MLNVRSTARSWHMESQQASWNVESDRTEHLWGSSRNFCSVFLVAPSPVEGKSSAGPCLKGPSSPSLALPVCYCIHWAFSSLAAALTPKTLKEPVWVYAIQGLIHSRQKTALCVKLRSMSFAPPCAKQEKLFSSVQFTLFHVSLTLSRIMNVSDSQWLSFFCKNIFMNVCTFYHQKHPLLSLCHFWYWHCGLWVLCYYVLQFSRFQTHQVQSQ